MVTRKVQILLYICVLLQLNNAEPGTSENEATDAKQVSTLIAPVHDRDVKMPRTVGNETNTIRTDPISIQINRNEEARFQIYFRSPLVEAIEVSFSCQGDKGCTTFSPNLEPVKLTPLNSSTMIIFTPTSAGHDVIELHVRGNTTPVNMDYGYVRVRVGRSNFLHVISIVFGWLYFIGWSISFWPQNIKNYQRKSVVGLSFDYTLLHFTGMIFYSIFNCILFFSEHVQDEYEHIHERSEIPVELNDVVYSLHAAATTSITWCQCMIYDGGNQRLSLVSKLFQGVVWIVGTGLAITATLNVTKWLDFIYFFSYVKLLVTAVKYLPQLFFNFQRKSTAGWSIWMVYLDISGGFMSMLQMLTLSYNFNDWQILVGNFPKLGLAIASMFYDVLFLLQEFVFYPGTNTPSANKRAQMGIKKLSLGSLEAPSINTVEQRSSKLSLPYPKYGTSNNDTNNNNNASKTVSASPPVNNRHKHDTVNDASKHV